MIKVKTLKRNAIIKGLDVSDNFYERLSLMVLDVAALASEDPETYQQHLETLITLMTTLDELAESQGLTEESEIEDSPVKDPDPD